MNSMAEYAMDDKGSAKKALKMDVAKQHATPLSFPFGNTIREISYDI